MPAAIRSAFIAGGTGTLGRLLAKRLSEAGVSVTIFSRDELKQHHMAAEGMPGVRFVIGDVRELEAVREAMRGHDAIFHVAALKHVDACEMNPEEAIRTNLIGTMNVAKAAVQCGSRWCVFCSTDKAVLPINVYGMTKALAEKYLWHKNRLGVTRFSVFRWGNVIASRGSVIPVFIHGIRHGEVPVTDTRMTRFWLTAERAADFMLSEFQSAPLDRPLIPEIKASSIMRVVERLAALLGIKQCVLRTVGIRPGEKLHECLFSSHDVCMRSDTSAQYTDAELDALLSPFVEAV